MTATAFTFNATRSDVIASYFMQVTSGVNLNNGLVGHWTMDGSDVSGTTVADQGSWGNNGTLGGSTASTFSAGILGQGFTFDGIDDAISMGDIANLDTATQLSGCAWTKHTTDTNDDWIMSKYDSVGVKGFMLFRDDVSSVTSRTDIYSVYLDESGGSDSVRLETPANVAKANSWNHICFTYQNNSATGLRLYLNGAEVADSPKSTTAIAAIDAGTTGFILGKEWSSASPLAGNIDDVRLYDRPITPDEVTRLYAMGDGKLGKTRTDRFTNGLVGHWTMDGPQVNWSNNTVVDLSGSGYTGTMTNMDKNFSSRPGQMGQALAFDGAEDYLTVGNNLNMGTNDFSISAWTKSTSTAVGNNNGVVYKKTGTSQSYTAGYRLNMPNGAYSFSIADGTNVRSLGAGSGYNDGNWHHVTATADRGNEMRIYIDGVLINSTPEITVGNIDSTWNLSIGAMYNPPNVWHEFNGSLDDVRIYNRVLTPDEITGLYNLGQVKINKTRKDRVTNGLVGHWTMDGTNIDWSASTSEIKDISGNSRHGDAAGGLTSVNAIPAVIGQGIQSKNASHSIVVADHASISGFNEMTLSAWFKPDQYPSGEVHLIAHAHTAAPHQAYGFLFSATGHLSFYTRNTSSAWVGNRRADPLTIGKWHHVVGRYNGSRVTVSVDGVDVSQYTGNQTGQLYDAASSLRIFDWNIFGSLDDVRLYNRALTDAEIKDLYLMGQ